MIKSSSPREFLGKTLLGAGLAAFCTLLVACSGSGSSSSNAGEVLGSGFLPTGSGTGTGVSPQISALTPSVLFPGELLTLTGTGFGASQLDTSRILFATGVNAQLDAGAVATPTDWTDTKIRIAVPSAAVTGPVQIVLNQRTVNEVRSNQPIVNIKRAFDPQATPKIIFINPSQGQFVGQNTPITVIFDRPILLSSITGNPTITSAISLVSVNQPNPSPNPATDTKNAEGACERPVVCDLRTVDLINCSCTFPLTVLGIEDISSELRATKQTAFRITHSPFSGHNFVGANNDPRFVADRTVVISVNNIVRTDGTLNNDGTSRSTPGPNIPTTGEFRFFFVN